jgi:hypothetical protein
LASREAWPKGSRLAPDAVLPNTIRLCRNQDLPNRFDVELRADAAHTGRGASVIERLKSYDRIECHVVFYPYSRTICSNDIHFYPFEEYVDDVLSNQRSAYAEIHSSLDQVFGLLLGLFIALAFARFKPQSLLEIEAIVSVFGAYAIGKELWHDIERMLVNVSKNWRLCYQESYYRYRLEKRTTLTHYSHLAKRQRYGKATLLPDKIDFIKQSNSQTLRMCFDTRDLDLPRDLDALPGTEAGQTLSAHVHSIHVNEGLMDDLLRDGFMFGLKLSYNRRILGITRALEVFQSLNKQSIGCLDDTGKWHEGALFYRNTLTLGRIKLYLNNGLLPGVSILDVQIES